MSTRTIHEDATAVISAWRDGIGQHVKFLALLAPPTPEQRASGRELRKLAEAKMRERGVPVDDSDHEDEG